MAAPNTTKDSALAAIFTSLDSVKCSIINFQQNWRNADDDESSQTFYNILEFIDSSCRTLAFQLHCEGIPAATVTVSEQPRTPPRAPLALPSPPATIGAPSRRGDSIRPRSPSPPPGSRIRSPLPRTYSFYGEDDLLELNIRGLTRAHEGDLAVQPPDPPSDEDGAHSCSSAPNLVMSAPMNFVFCLDPVLEKDRLPPIHYPGSTQLPAQDDTPIAGPSNAKRSRSDEDNAAGLDRTSKKARSSSTERMPPPPVPVFHRATGERLGILADPQENDPVSIPRRSPRRGRSAKKGARR